MFVRPIILDACVKLRDPCLNRSRRIPPEAVRGGIFDSFFHYDFRPVVDNDVISRPAVDNIGLDVRVKLDVSRSNGSRDILFRS